METYSVPVTDRNTPTVMLGDMGVKKIYQGDTLLYERKAAYFYVVLDNSETNKN